VAGQVVASRGDVALKLLSGSEAELVERGRNGVVLTLDDLRWLMHTAAPCGLDRMACDQSSQSSAPVQIAGQRAIPA
jgi:hypothetical protein